MNLFMQTVNGETKPERVKRQTYLRRLGQSLTRDATIASLEVTVQEGGKWLDASYDEGVLGLLGQLSMPERHIHIGSSQFTFIDELSIKGGMHSRVVIHSLKFSVGGETYLYDSHFRGIKPIDTNYE